MKRYLIAAALLFMAGCASPSTPTPTRTVVVVQPPPPVVIQPANFQYGDGVLNCVRGFCFSFSMNLTNIGPGCATDVHVQVFWYGSDGAVFLPNTPSIVMDANGLLSQYIFRQGTTVPLTSRAGFNDVRSAHTVYRAAGTWTNVAC